jgi:hypothetical protein
MGPQHPSSLRPGRIAEGPRAPANSPVVLVQPNAQSIPVTAYQLMLAHIVGGAYSSPNVDRPGSPATPQSGRSRSYTPCLLATPAGQAMPGEH